MTIYFVIGITFFVIRAILCFTQYHKYGFRPSGSGADLLSESLFTLIAWPLVGVLALGRKIANVCELEGNVRKQKNAIENKLKSFKGNK